MGAVLVSSLLFTSAFALPNKDNGTEPKKAPDTTIISTDEIDQLLATYNAKIVPPSTAVLIKIYSENDHLIFSLKVNRCDLEKDVRLQSLLDQAYYITEIDDTRIYISKK